MPALFMLILPAPVGSGPESHTALQALLAHARTAGRDFSVQSQVLAASDDETGGLVHVLLRDVRRGVEAVRAEPA